jgi:hypothetical protein
LGRLLQLPCYSSSHPAQLRLPPSFSLAVPLAATALDGIDRRCPSLDVMLAMRPQQASRVVIAQSDVQQLADFKEQRE